MIMARKTTKITCIWMYALLRIALRGKVDLFSNGPRSVEVDATMHNTVIIQHHNSKVS